MVYPPISRSRSVVISNAYASFPRTCSVPDITSYVPKANSDAWAGHYPNRFPYRYALDNMHTDYLWGVNRYRSWYSHRWNDRWRWPNNSWRYGRYFYDHDKPWTPKRYLPFVMHYTIRRSNSLTTFPNHHPFGCLSRVYSTQDIRTVPSRPTWVNWGTNLYSPYYRQPNRLVSDWNVSPYRAIYSPRINCYWGRSLESWRYRRHLNYDTSCSWNTSYSPYFSRQYYPSYWHYYM
ncbi:hypothetical protein M3Y97_00884000 [Aphelenchoides bicaudatus]|nr:hypothetical protein M3Y97_00884000 [Aphelenchoides bicaudatus]